MIKTPLDCRHDYLNGQIVFSILIRVFHYEIVLLKSVDMKKLVFCVLFVGILFSCEKSEDNTATLEELNGTWELQSVNCFCFFPDGFDFSGHKIDFNNDEGTLTIENSAETLFITASGSYNFQVENKMIIIKDTWEFTFEINGDTLVLSNVDDPELADDEITLTYKKVN